MGKIIKPPKPNTATFEELKAKEKRNLEKERQAIEEEVRNRSRRGALAQTIKTSETGVLKSSTGAKSGGKTLLGA